MGALAMIVIVLIGLGIPLYLIYAWYSAMVEGEKPSPLDEFS